MARQLATDLNAIPFSNGASATYARDVDLETQQITGPKLWVDATQAEQLVARSQWGQAITLQVTAIAPRVQNGQDGSVAVEAEKDAWLDFIDDEVIAVIRTTKNQGRLPTQINFVHRLKSAALREGRQLLTQFQIVFPLV